MRNKNNLLFIQGFTLLEVMVAMAIIAITLVAVFNSQSQSVSLACESRFYTTGPLLAQKKMAELDMVETADLMSDSGDFEGFSDYQWELKVETPAFNSPENVSERLKQLDLVVSYGKDKMNSCHIRLFRFSPK